MPRGGGYKSAIVSMIGDGTGTMAVSQTGINNIRSLYIVGPEYSVVRDAYPAVYTFCYIPDASHGFSFGFNSDRYSDFENAGTVSFSSTTLQIDLDTNIYVFAQIPYLISFIYD